MDFVLFCIVLFCLELFVCLFVYFWFYVVGLSDLFVFGLFFLMFFIIFVVVALLFVIDLCLLCPKLPFSLDCPVLIVPLVFSSVECCNCSINEYM